MRKVLVLAFVFLSITAFAQKGAIKGFVYDQNNGEGIAFATVQLKDSSGIGASTDDRGFFSIPNLPAGTYLVSISYLGYETRELTVEVKNSPVNLKVLLSTKSVELKDVEISGEKEKKTTETRVSVTSISPTDIKRIPMVGGEADVAQYLQILPGVVSTGDQGGQIIIRGGTPIQTQFLLDGIPIFNPFHSIGLFSVYETDVIKNVDVYSGGFPAQYGTRTGAVVDVTTRDGNKRNFSGKISASPFMAHALLEIPIVKLKEDEHSTSASLIMNAKVSYLDQSSKVLYKYADKNGLPYSFVDVYGKFNLNTGYGNKFNISGFYNQDTAKFAAAKYGWSTFGIGANFLAVPKNSNLYFNTHFSYSNYKIGLDEADGRTRQSSIGGFDIGMDFNYYIRQGDLKYGLDVQGNKTNFAFVNSFGQTVTQDQNTTDLSAYVTVHKFYKKFVAEGGFRFQYYGNLGAISPEPRLSMKYNATNWLRFKMASGLYSQNIISTVSNQDVVDLFTGFLTGSNSTPANAPKDSLKSHNMQRGVDAIFGIEMDLPKNISINIEPYYKYFWHLLDINQYKVYNTDPDFMNEKGDAYGLDFLFKWQYKGAFLYATYSLSWVHRNDGEQVYYPYYDRRHNVNVVAAYTFGKKHDWEASGRWNLGSGFPFTQTQGFYEFNPFSNGIATNYTTTNGTLGVVYSSTIDGGRLPLYHRLDLQIKKVFNLKKRMKVDIAASVSNVYNRDNIFYFDRIHYVRVNQLPVIPSLAASFSW